MKSQASNPKHQGNFKLQISKRVCARSQWSLMIGTWCFLGFWGLGFGPSEEGYGPATSVPVTRSTITRASLPPRNWIDQSQAEADRKSVKPQTPKPKEAPSPNHQTPL